MRPMPHLEFQLAPCPKCGATNEEEAETKCKPTRDITDEYVCPGEFRAGHSVQPTAASIAAQDRWYAEAARAEGL